jgi:hypothetical protein
MRALKIAMGPATPHASWRWVGEDLIPLLARHHEVRVVRESELLLVADFDLLMLVKHLPCADDLAGLKDYNQRILYFPVDHFTSVEHIKQEAAALRLCDVLLVHSERLADELRPYCQSVELVEHYCKHALPTMNRFRPDGFVLWVGHLQNLAPVCQWFTHSSSRIRLKILTNLPERLELMGAAGTRLHEIEWHPWTEALQNALFIGARAGLDIKGNQFQQRTKPPTKAQQFVASGIPVALNRESYGFEYFRSRGFEPATPDEPERWFSEEYWRETCKFGEKLRLMTSPDAVADSYLRVIANL